VSKKKLPIPPWEIGGKIEMVKLSDLKPGHKVIINFPEAIVAYLDVLGVSKKQRSKDIRLTLLDFSSPLALAASKFKKVRFNVFSDCAFVAASKTEAHHLISALRFAFKQWISDGILVRGGVSLGKYSETKSIAISLAPNNFQGNIFGGSGVFNAVKLEHSGKGSFLFTNKKCSSFFEKNYKEPTYLLGRNRFLGWSDDPCILSSFLGISLWRLIRIEHANKTRRKSEITEHLINNILYSYHASENQLPFSLLLAILSSPTISNIVRKNIIKIFKINDPEDFNTFKEITAGWFKHPDFKKIKWIADSDSSLH